MNPTASAPSKGPMPGKRPPGGGLFLLLKPHRQLVVLVVFLTIAGNALNLAVPKLISGAIDAYQRPGFDLAQMAIRFAAVAISVFVLLYLQSVVQTYAAEKVARDLRGKVAAKISVQSYGFVEMTTPAKLLTNLTSDIDGVKTFVSMAFPTIISSLFLIIGSSVMLLTTNFKLGLSVLGVVPLVGGTFFFALRKVRELFKRGQEAVDWLNRVINESILGAMLVRVLHSEDSEARKFEKANTESYNVGISILKIMSGMIPAITLAINLATVIILLLGGRFVMNAQMTLGEFTAFNTYLFILVFPIIVLGFMSTIMAQAGASYGRLMGVLMAPPVADTGSASAELRGGLAVDDVSLTLGEKQVLRNVSFAISPGTSNAIIGPTAAGKTQLLYALIGLLKPSSGTISYDGTPLDSYDKSALHRQVGIAFQDSILFNLSLRENIAFSSSVSDQDLDRAIRAAELHEFVGTLPQGLDTLVSERGTTLSGGQKQRVMLARALALNPKVLLLDDFTARVDTSTEKAILANIHSMYPGITILSVTQKIASAVECSQVILLMEGEVLAKGTHAELMENSPEYVQIFDSQRSTNAYEV